MNKKSLNLLLILGMSSITSNLFGSGGMIGGSQVKLQAILSCQAKGIDPTFPSSVTAIDVAQELDYNGQVQAELGETLRLFDARGEVIRYLPLEGEVTFGVWPKLRVYNYRAGSTNRKRLGYLLFNEQAHGGAQGVLRPVAGDYELPELVLTNCRWIAQAQR